jgi:hypothetical protein
MGIYDFSHFKGCVAKIPDYKISGMALNVWQGAYEDYNDWGVEDNITEVAIHMTPNIHLTSNITNVESNFHRKSYWNTANIKGSV